MKRITSLFVVMAVLFNSVVGVVGVNAEWRTSPLSQSIYQKETNMEWFEICSPDDFSPYNSGFYPTDYPEYILPVMSVFRSPVPILDVSPNFPDDVFASMPVAYIQEGISPYNGEPECIWDAFVEPLIFWGDTYNMASTPFKDFSHNVEFADVTFAYSCNDQTALGLLWRPYRIRTIWSDGTETVTSGDVCTGSTMYQGYVSKSIAPRSGKWISNIKIEFPNVELGFPLDWLGVVAMPKLLLDRILIRGFYRDGTPFPTITPTPTRTPTVGPTPTQTTTPRAIWITPTPGTPEPTKQFPPHYGSIPTRIPPISFPDWDLLIIPTPPWHFTMPLIPTPPPLPTRAPFTFTIPISYSTPASFFPPTVTATPTVSGTITATITPTETITPTATATRADIVASMNLAATNLYSEAAVMSNPTTFTIQSAPVEYAPALPRPMADIGYTFENMQGNIGFLYDPRAWASLLGYIAAVPFQLLKFFYTMAQMMGPVGLFVTWLLVLLPFVLFARMFVFIKNLIISIINLVVKIIRFIGDIWDIFPGL